MIDRQRPDDEYSPFVVSPRAVQPPRASTPFVERDAAARAVSDDGWRETFGAYASPDAPSHEVEKTTKHPDCSDSGDGIFGKDDRVAVSNSLAVPYRWICQLSIRQRNSDGAVERSGATGILVSPRHVLTVAHAITGSKRDNRNQLITYEAFDIFVSPARDGSDLPFGKVSLNFPVHIAPGWTARGMPAAFDYALLTLENAIGDDTSKRLSGAQLCYWGALSCAHPAVAYRVDPATLRNAAARTAGYPKDRGNGEHPFETTGVLSGVYEKVRTMQFSGDACQGQSGSPVWVTVDKQHRLVGIMSRVGPNSATVVRITQELSRQLRKWMGNASEAFVEPVGIKSPGMPQREQWNAPVFKGDHGEADTEYAGEAVGDESYGGESESHAGESFAGEPNSEQSYGDGSHAHEASAGERTADESPDHESYRDTESVYSEAETPWTESGSEHAGDASNHEVIAPSETLRKEPRPRTIGRADESEDEDTQLPEHQAAVRPTLRHLAFMSSLATPLDPGIYDADGRYRAAAALQTCVDAVGVLPAARGMQIALVDLSKSVASPEFAGVRHTAQAELASIRKLIVMYAAFQLQEDLRRLKAATAPATRDALIATQLARWSATQTVAAATPITTIAGNLGRKGDLITWKGKPIELPAASAVPDIPEIVASLSTLNFRRSDLSVVASPWDVCDEFVVLLLAEHSGNDWADGVLFEQRMRMMIGLSDNRATASCIGNIGFAYINALMVQSGLWHPARNGGLWLSGNYAGKGWRGSPDGAGGNGTAGALAALLTLLVRGQLVNAAASTQMLAIMTKKTYPGAGTQSPVLEALQELGGAWRAQSKLGLLYKPTRLSDAAIVQRSEGGKSLQYAIVVLNATDAGGVGSVRRLRTVVQALHQCIRTNNGLP